MQQLLTGLQAKEITSKLNNKNIEQAGTLQVLEKTTTNGQVRKMYNKHSSNVEGLHSRPSHLPHTILLKRIRAFRFLAGTDCALLPSAAPQLQQRLPHLLHLVAHHVPVSVPRLDAGFLCL